ncbi:TonB-dependent receptor domain-containing protein [Sphingomonas sp. ACRSK]|uniref:TonB-dependent receptor domain-containing protein n=1 Tax=Sphingomonas sp. ACRSK TaxID=2918213 RepID=UPI001EF5E5B3|nr:TonB-dependent receptor [Sphingomonas sp. ACRSK]
MKTMTRLLLASTCIAGVAAMPAMAQEANVTGGPVVTDSALEAPQANEEAPADSGGAIVVTGSRISRPNVTAAAPITSVTSESIRAQAAVNIEEVLNRIPQVAPDSQQNYADSDGRQRIKLRNLGFERTLVLVDGKRLGTVNGLDANMIPTSLIKRVDVLTGGASAVYGSDAIAGVVNFVLDDDFEGVQINGNYNFYAHNNKPGLATEVANGYNFAQPARGNAFDGGRTDVSITAGKKLFDDRFHISGYVNYREAEMVPFSARETAACELTQPVKDGALGCTTSTYSPFGYISPGAGPNAGNTYVNNPNGSGTLLPYSEAYAANPYDGYSFQRANKRWNAGGFASFEISPAAEVYASTMWFRDKSSNPFPARVLSSTAYGDGNTKYTVNCNNPYLSAAQAQIICGANAGTAASTPIELRYRANGVDPIEDTYINKGLRITGGVRGAIAEGWSYDVGGVYARNQMNMTWGRPNFDRVNNALDVVSSNGTIVCRDASDGCVPFNPFAPNSAVNDQALFDYLMMGGYGTNKTVNTLYNAIVTVQGDLGQHGITSPWAEQGVAIAFGAEYREDQLDSTANAVWREQNGGTDQHLSQNVWEGNVELQVPIAENKPFADLLQLNGAFRVSKYSTNPKAFTTWKAEAIWAPIPDITFRASMNRAQRAPTVTEAFQASNSSYDRIDPNSFNDFCAPTITGYTTNAAGQRVPIFGAPQASREVCAATGLADNLYGSATLLCPTDVGCTTRSGGFTVDPETAYTKTFGIVLKPRFLPGLTVSVDRYMIDLNDSIGYNNYDFFRDGCLSSGNDFFCSMFVRNADGTLYSPTTTNAQSGYVRSGTTNYYKSKSYGWDFQGQYALRMGSAGKLDFDFSGSLTTLLGAQDAPTLNKRNCVGYYGGAGCGQFIPKWTHNLRGTYTTDDGVFSASLNWRYLGPLTNVSNSGDTNLGWTPGSTRTTFYEVKAISYFDLALAFRVNEQFSWRVAANNIFDKSPPVFPNSRDVTGLFRNNTISSRYDILGRQIAVGATINF